MSVTAVLVKTAAAQGVIPTDVTAFQGEQVMFNCSGSEVRWFRRDDKLFTSPDEFHGMDTNKFSIIGHYYLVIKDVQARSDAGTYKCDTDEHSHDVQSANLVVLGNMSVKCLCAS